MNGPFAIVRLNNDGMMFNPFNSMYTRAISYLFLVDFHRLPPGITWYAIEMWENQTKNLGMGSRAEMGMCRFGVHHKVYWMVLEAMPRSAYKKVKSNSTTLHTSSWPISMNRCFKASYPFLWDALTCRSTLGSRVWSPCDLVILKGWQWAVAVRCHFTQGPRPHLQLVTQGKWPTVAGWLVRAHTLQRRQVEQFLVEKPEVLKDSCLVKG